MNTEKMKMHSMDLTSENVKKIGELFPNCISECKNDGELVFAIDFDTLRQELSRDIFENPIEQYRFTWPGKSNAIRIASEPINKTLRPYRDESVDFDNTENIYIEGDNLDVLKLLQETYLGKIRIIYIDPPYNTGNDFVYNDSFDKPKDEYKRISGEFNEENNRLVQNLVTNGRFHTDWLNMIYPRLKIAKNLLSEDGVIFISIDDNEVENLKKICNEIFGELNFCGQYMWYRSATPPNLSHKIKRNLEYILCYQKSNTPKRFYGIKKESKSSDPLTKPQNSIKTLTFPPHSINIDTEDKTIAAGVYGTKKYPNKLLNNLIVANRTNQNEVTFENKFIWKQETLNENIKNETSFFLSKDLVLSYKRKEYLPEVPPNLIDMSVGVNTTEEAGKKLDELFGVDNIFDYPKPVSLIKYLINFNEKKEDDIILDFFSGSSTTAQAIMELNAEDGGNRRFIMVQLPEVISEESAACKAGFKNICEIGKKRIHLAGEKIKKENKDKINEIDFGFRVFKLDSSNMKEVFYNPAKFDFNMLDGMIDNIKANRTSEDLLVQVMLDLGVLPSSRIVETKIDGKIVFDVADSYLVACFEKGITDEVIKEIAMKKPTFFVTRDSSLAGDSVATNFEQIFETYSSATIRKVI